MSQIFGFGKLTTSADENEQEKSADEILPFNILDHLVSVHYIVHMKAITYTEAREKLSETIKKVCNDHDPVIITRKRDNSVVMISLEDYDSLLETAYLLKNRKNASRILASIKEIEEKKGKERNLVE